METNVFYCGLDEKEIDFRRIELQNEIDSDRFHTLISVFEVRIIALLIKLNNNKLEH